jgi:phosphatidylethanolamine-binding protein (PEBP) family uncharacterized protein
MPPSTDVVTHWVAYGIPGDLTELPEDAGGQVDSGTNSFFS